MSNLLGHNSGISTLGDKTHRGTHRQIIALSSTMSQEHVHLHASMALLSLTGSDILIYSSELSSPVESLLGHECSIAWRKMSFMAVGKNKNKKENTGWPTKNKAGAAVLP